MIALTLLLELLISSGSKALHCATLISLNLQGFVILLLFLYAIIRRLDHLFMSNGAAPLHLVRLALWYMLS